MKRVACVGGALLVGLTALTPRTEGQPPPPPGGQPGGPIAGLTPGEQLRWQNGQNAFVRPADLPGGLGPVFNDNACAKCHGAPGAAPGGASRRLVTRFGRVVNGQFDPMLAFGGPSIQERGIGPVNGVNFVGEVVPRQATIVTARRTTPTFGLGLVDAVPDATFVALANRQAVATPATAGRPSPFLDPATGATHVGRFGWKAQQPALALFTADALLNEMGVTTPLAPAENCPQGNCALLSANPARRQPNADNTLVQQITDFMALSAPPPPGPASAAATAGQALFATIGCANCHQPTLQTGPSPVAALSFKTFRPYSDFLLHDMGSLGDGTVQGAAGPREMRTAPLWGLRFQPTLLHDGRAATPADAILAHDGQGRPSRDRFNALTPTQKSQVIAFLNSL